MVRRLGSAVGAVLRVDSAARAVLRVWGYRCRTRSLISAVRPWFQNWVPM